MRHFKAANEFSGRGWSKGGWKFYLIAVIALLVMSAGADAAVEKKTESKGGVSTGIEDQTGIEVTIYNSNLALVKDLRKITLLPGPGELRFMDVAAHINPASLHIKSLTDPDSLKVIEQNYEYDLLNPQKLLDKYIGRDVNLYQKNPYTEREEIVTARVLSNNDGPIFKIGDEITFGHPGRIIFPGVPEDLLSKPTLVWLIENSLPSSHNIEASYLTGGIGWKADYVLTLDQRDDKADLSGWVTINNSSGATYREARLKLVAGDVNRVKERDEFDYKPSSNAFAAEALQSRLAMFKEDSFSEYHIYTLQRTATLKDKQAKQISLINAGNLAIKKEFIAEGRSDYYSGPYAEFIKDRKASVYIEVENRKENNLGIPLPKGTVRVYKKDNEGSLQFAGEDKIEHTPENEKIRLKLGEAFDVIVNRKQTYWKKLDKKTCEAEVEIVLRNHKQEDITVKVIEPVPGDWKMLTSSHEYSKSEAFSAEFNIPVPKDKEVKLKYRVRLRQ